MKVVLFFLVIGFYYKNDIFENRLTTITKLFQYPTIQKLAAELSQDKAQQQVKKWIYQSNCYSMASYQRQIRQAHRHHQR